MKGEFPLLRLSVCNRRNIAFKLKFFSTVGGVIYQATWPHDIWIDLRFDGVADCRWHWCMQCPRRRLGNCSWKVCTNRFWSANQTFDSFIKTLHLVWPLQHDVIELSFVYGISAWGPLVNKNEFPTISLLKQLIQNYSKQKWFAEFYVFQWLSQWSIWTLQAYEGLCKMGRN